MTLEEAKKLVGQRVVILNAIGSDCIAGELQFVGINENLNWGLQVTVERMPIQVKSLDQIVKCEGRLSEIGLR